MSYSTLAEYAAYFLVLIFGLSVGSFLNVVIYRLPREGMSISKPSRSFCPACQANIHWYDNIPILSWLFLRARCRHCGRAISARYPLVEMAAGLLALYLWHSFHPSIPGFLFYFYFVMCLLSIALIDLELMLIPTRLMYPTTVLGLVSAAVEPSIFLTGPWLWDQLEPSYGPRAAALAGAVLGLALGWGTLKLVSAGYKIARGVDGMGDGDPPLLGMIGVFLGWRAVPLIILWSTLIGLFSVGILIISAKGKPPEEGWGRKPLPFGPFLVLAALLYLFFGQNFIHWYWSLTI